MKKEELKLRIEILRNIVMQLEILALDTPYQITMIPARKNFSNEWLKENDFGYMIGIDKYVKIFREPTEQKD